MSREQDRKHRARARAEKSEQERVQRLVKVNDVNLIRTKLNPNLLGYEQLSPVLQIGVDTRNLERGVLQGITCQFGSLMSYK